MKVRVVQRVDGQVSIIRPAASDLPSKQFEAVCAQAIEQSAGTPTPLVGLAFVDLDESELPARTAACPDAGCGAEHRVRDQWSLKGKRVVIDETAPNAHRELDHVYRRIEQHMEQDAPDPIEHARLLADARRLVPMTHGRQRAEVQQAIQAARARRPVKTGLAT